MAFRACNPVHTENTAAEHPGGLRCGGLANGAIRSHSVGEVRTMTCPSYKRMEFNSLCRVGGGGQGHLTTKALAGTEPQRKSHWRETGVRSGSLDIIPAEVWGEAGISDYLTAAATRQPLMKSCMHSLLTSSKC